MSSSSQFSAYFLASAISKVWGIHASNANFYQPRKTLVQRFTPQGCTKLPMNEKKNVKKPVLETVSLSLLRSTAVKINPHHHPKMSDPKLEHSEGHQSVPGDKA